MRHEIGRFIRRLAFAVACSLAGMTLFAAPAQRVADAPPDRDPGPSPGCVGAACDVLEQVARAAAGVQQAKGGFVNAVFQFVPAAAGEAPLAGGDLGALVEAMAAALAGWDEAIRRYEASLRPLPASVDSQLARAVVHLDRSNLATALRELDTAARLDPGRAEVFVLRALIYDRQGRDDAVARELEQAADRDGRNAGVLYALGSARLRLGQTGAAEAAWARLVALEQRRGTRADGAPFAHVTLYRSPEGAGTLLPPAIYVEGFDAMARGEFDAGIASFRRAAAADPAAGAIGDAAIAGAALAIRSGDLQGAIARLEAAIGERPLRAERHRLLGTLYRADDRLDASIEQFRAAVAAAPADERSHVALADALGASGRESDAVEVLAAALRMVPGSAQAHHRLGLLYQSLARPADALAAFEAAARVTPIVGHDRLLETIAVLRLQEADVEGAAAAHRVRVRVDPNNAAAHRALGQVCARLGRGDEAGAEFAAALLLRPRDVETYVARAQMHLERAEFAQAEAAAREAVALQPGHAAARYALGTALVRLGRSDQAAPELELFRQLQAQAVASERRQLDLRLLQQSAWARAERGDFDAAADLLREALAFDPAAGDAHLSLGVVLERAGRHEEALVSLTRAAERGAEVAVYRHLGGVYRALGRTEEARRADEQYARAKADRMRGASR